MKTVDKAMALLGQFTAARGEMGLTEISRLSGLDKAATRRILVALGGHGYVEQNPESRKYRLGPGFLTLAHVREATAPIGRVAAEAAAALTGATAETAHVSIPGPAGMIPAACKLPNRATVINLDPGQTLPLHATASGLIYLGGFWARRSGLPACRRRWSGSRKAR
ncbi:MAG: helix-turn-helix domain-containing protein [Paracoccaceae bacterium]